MKQLAVTLVYRSAGFLFFFSLVKAKAVVDA
jgi:hypothetical protein